MAVEANNLKNRDCILYVFVAVFIVLYKYMSFQTWRDERTVGHREFEAARSSN